MKSQDSKAGSSDPYERYLNYGIPKREAIHMKSILLSALALMLSSMGAPAQTSTTRAPFVSAVGTATVTFQPDQATIDLGVVTQGQTASAASTQNAAQTAAVISALTSLLGAGGSLKTISYSLTANYSYPQNGPPILTGFTATNTVEITMSNLAGIGQAIDTGIQAGANQVVGLTFGLKDDSQARSQALMQATAQASANAASMASGVGMHSGAVQLISEGTTVTPVGSAAPGTASSAVTPIVTGTLSIQATVTLNVALTQ